jgi:hypothetical protein
VFSVIGGYVAKREGQLVRAVLADGRTWIYDPEDANGAWLFAVQRCGDFAETAFRAVEEINQDGTVIVRLPVPCRPASPRRRQLRILNASPRRACGRPQLSTIRQRSVEPRHRHMHWRRLCLMLEIAWAVFGELAAQPNGLASRQS